MALALEGERGNGADEGHVQLAGLQAVGELRGAGEGNQFHIQAFRLKISFFLGDKAQEVGSGVEVAQGKIRLFRRAQDDLLRRQVLRGSRGDQGDGSGFVRPFRFADTAAILGGRGGGQEQEQSEKQGGYLQFHI